MSLRNLAPVPASLACRLAAFALLLAGGGVVLACSAPDAKDASPPVRVALEECRGLGDSASTACYLERVEHRVREAGTGAALDMLSELAGREPGVNADGHRFVHAVGMAAYRKAGRLHEAFESCTDLFQSGCRHGTIQAHFTSLDSVGGDAVRQVCQPYHQQGRELLAFQCHHGLGHGLTMYFGHHLPRALAMCDALGTDETRHSCYGGAFMENAVHGTRPHRHGAAVEREESPGAGPSASEWTAVDSADPHHPCSVVAERYLTACYELQTSIMIHLNDGSLKATVEECEEAPEGWRTTCFQSLGRSISIRSYDDLERAVRLCRVGAEHLRPHCFQGLAHTLMILGTRPFPEVGFDLCRRVSAAERAERLRCWFAVGRALEPRLGDTERRRWCDRAPRPDDRRACRIGAGLEAGRLDETLGSG